jgi:abortive infection bacteriophage resistance protein
MKYNKPALTFNQQIKLLQSRGLVISDITNAKDILSRISYYRLSAYFLPFEEKRDTFRKDIRLEHIIQLFLFDHNLKYILWEGIEALEVALRTQITYFFSLKYEPFGYIQKDNFSLKFIGHQKWLEEIEKELSRSKETFVEHFRNKYNESKALPIWMMTELMSFGALSIMYKGLKADIKREVSKIFSLEYRLYASAIHSIVFIRNICAHHGRLWNREMAIAP